MDTVEPKSISQIDSGASGAILVSVGRPGMANSPAVASFIGRGRWIRIPGSQMPRSRRGDRLCLGVLSGGLLSGERK